MRVLVYTNLFPSFREPTRGIYNFFQFGALAKYCDIRVVCPVAAQNRLKSAPRELLSVPLERHAGLDVSYPTFVPIVRMAPRVNPLLMYGMTRYVVERIHASFPFDVIFAAWGYPDAVAALRMARKYRCPQVTQLLGSDMNLLTKEPSIERMITATLTGSASVATMSSAMADSVARLGIPRSRIYVQHNGVDQERFRLRDMQEMRSRLGLPADTRIVVCVGNHVEVKGPDILVDAFARLVANTNQKVRLVLVGDGPMKAQLESAAREKNISEQVLFAGRRLHTEIPEWIAAADVLCLPSRAEGCPNVVLEAFASGRPVVASAVGAVPDLVTPLRGKIAAPGDAERLAVCLREAIEADWDAQAIRASIADLTWDAVGRRYFEILSEAVERHGSRSTHSAAQAHFNM